MSKGLISYQIDNRTFTMKKQLKCEHIDVVCYYFKWEVTLQCTITTNPTRSSLSKVEKLCLQVSFCSFFGSISLYQKVNLRGIVGFY